MLQMPHVLPSPAMSRMFIRILIHPQAHTELIMHNVQSIETSDEMHWSWIYEAASQGVGGGMRRVEAAGCR
jgi:hypothetical protein